MDNHTAQINMLKHQIRTWDVTNEQVLDIIMDTPRAHFVPEGQKELAYADTAIALNCGQHMLTPKIEARMLGALRLTGTEKVLEIGTGSGYFTALLAKSAKHVHSIENHLELAESALAKLDALDLLNVTIQVGDGAQGWAEHEPYDVIVVTASMPTLPDSFKENLKIGGKIVAILGGGQDSHVTLVSRTTNTQFESAILFETAAPALENITHKAPFKF
jgi:protein-L-isoaspartate(D-aspartate) O-methyltransferase